ncbi:MAG: GNAT family N-acetyltransferase [Chthoniobacterales bacterium]
MKLTNWIRFTWDLAKLPLIATKLPGHYEISPARAEDEAELRKVISRSFLLDPTWNPAMHEVIETVEPWLDHAFASANVVRLALRHGSRIIGASILTPDQTSENHLAPGPCVLMEYRNRGFGTRLLEQSLLTLRDSGVSQAAALTEENALVTKFLYTKFHGTTLPRLLSPLLAA